MSFDSLWGALETTSGGSSPGYVTRRIKPDAACDLRLAIEKPSNTRLMLLRVSSSSLRNPVEFPKSLGFEARRVFLPGDGAGYVTLSIRLTHPRFRDVFTCLAEDVANHVALSKNDAAAIKALVSRLERWQEFLKKHPVEGLGDQSQRGLFGEVLFLRQYMIPHLGSRAGIAAWTGPNGANQDFQIPAAAIEIKTSSAKQHQTLEISSERQLDGTGVSNLLIYHLSLDARQGGGETLVDAIESVRTLLVSDPVALQQFEDRLFQLGYLDMHAANYSATGYTVRETNFFRVIDGFPRIVEGDLRKGVGDVRYTISVSECKNFSIGQMEVVQLLGESSNGG